MYAGVRSSGAPYFDRRIQTAAQKGLKLTLNGILRAGLFLPAFVAGTFILDGDFIINLVHGFLSA